jgi:hypothetical protein
MSIGARGDAVVTSRDEVAALQNVLGVYLIDPDGTIRDPEIVFVRIEHAEPACGSLLEPGDAVRLSNLYPAADLAPDRSSACIVIPDDAGSLIGLHAPSAGSTSHVNSFPSSLPLCRGGNPAHRRAR